MLDGSLLTVVQTRHTTAGKMVNIKKTKMIAEDKRANILSEDCLEDGVKSFGMVELKKVAQSSGYLYEVAWVIIRFRFPKIGKAGNLHLIF